MQNGSLTRKLVLSGVFAALICAVTALVRIPVPIPGIGAYINAGDAVIYASAVVIGGPWAAAAAGIGSMLADLIVGAGIYAPATLVIKALMGFVVGIAFAKKLKFLPYVGLMIVASLIMVAGYGAYEFFIARNVWLADIPFNLIQAGGGVLLGVLLALLLRRVFPAHWLSERN